MSSETPKGPSADRPNEPFTRGKIVWGRPPQQVFQVGPLPSAQTYSSRPSPPRSAPAAGAGILSGSMVPQAKPAVSAPVEAQDVEVPASEPVVEVVVPPPPVEPEIVATPAPQEIVVEPEAPEPALTVPPPLSSEVEPAAEPRSLPSVVVTPAIYASVGAAVQKVAKGSPWPIVAAVAAIAVIGGFIWLATLPAPQPVAPAATPLVAEAARVEETPLVEEAATVEAASAPARAAPLPEAAAPVPSAAVPQRRSQPTAPVTVTPRPADDAPLPAIEVAPLAVEPPTPAAPAPTNPDAPIATQPQPLN